MLSVCKHACSHTCMHMHAYTYTQTYTHVRAQTLQSLTDATRENMGVLVAVIPIKNV